MTTEGISNSRNEVDRLVESSQWGAAARRLAELWRNEHAPALAPYVVSRFEKLRGKVPLGALRVALLRSFTVEPIVPLLRAEAFCAGLDLIVHVGDFNAYAQEILDAESSLYGFAPDVVIVAVQTVDIVSDLWRDYADLSEEAAEKASQRAAELMGQYMREFRKRSSARSEERRVGKEC